MKKKLVSILCLFAMIVQTSVYEVHADVSYDIDDGKEYIVGLKDSNAVMLMSDEISMMEELSDDLNIYKTDDEKRINSLAAAGLVEYVEENAVVELFADNTYNDTYYSEQWSFDVANINAAKAVTKGSEDIVVGVVDSGVRSDHPDIKNLVPGKHFYDEGYQNADTEDEYGHGTAVAGIIGAAANNNEGIVGIAENVKIMPIRAFEGARGSLDDIIEGIDYAIENGCKVINFSAGLGADYTSMKKLADKAYENDVIFVASAGNGGKTGSTNDTKMYPASYDNVISVGSVGRSKTVATSSQKNNAVTIVAPGDGVISTAIENMAFTCTAVSADYSIVKGTSFSAPHISALAALAASIKPDITPDEFEEALISTAVDLGDEGKDNSYGYGLVDMGAVIEYIADNNDIIIEPTPTPTPTPELTPSEACASIENKLYLDTDGDGNAVITAELINNSERVINGIRIVAFFDENGALIPERFYFVETSLPSATKDGAGVDKYVITEDKESFAYAVQFFWRMDEITDIIPYAPVSDKCMNTLVQDEDV